MSRAARPALQAIFGGARIPADPEAALRAIDGSPLVPSDPEALRALREAVITHAGAEVASLAQAGRHVRHSEAGATQARPPSSLVAMRAAAEVPAPVEGPGLLERAVTPARARELFDALAAAPDIPHDFIDDGCMFRAHVMAKRLEEAGVYSEKIILSPTAGDLRINSPKAAIGFTLAMFHIAPVIFVRTDHGVERRVVDPSLCDGPATEAEWAASMEAVGGAPLTTVYASRFVLMPYDRDHPPATWDPRDLADAQAWNEQYHEVQRTMRESGFYEHLQELVATPPRSGE